MKRRPPPSAWRQPLVWLVFALPAMSVVAGFALLALAGRADRCGGRPRPPYRAGAGHRPQPGSRGATHGACRRAFIASAWCWTSCRSSAGFDRAVPLELVLRHPVLASKDRRVTLAPSVAGWSGRIGGFDDAHDWVLELAPPDRHWRLRGRWQAAAAHARGRSRAWRVRNECGRRRRTPRAATRRCFHCREPLPAHAPAPDAGRHRTRRSAATAAPPPRNGSATPTSATTTACAAKPPVASNATTTTLAWWDREDVQAGHARAVAGRPRTRPADRRHALRRLRLADRPRAAPRTRRARRVAPTR